VYGNLSPIPNLGKCPSVDAARSRISGAGFKVTVAPGQVASECPPGTVAKISPSGSSVKGSTITLYISRGGGGGPGGPGGPGFTRGP
jgi:beta-lactam-binding protein with PASTA domain